MLTYVTRLSERSCTQVKAWAETVAARVEALEQEEGDSLHSEKALRKLLFGMVNVSPLGAVDDLLILFEGILAHPSATRGASVADLLSDFATVLDANGDYYRKPQLAAWLQRVSTDLVATAPKL